MDEKRQWCLWIICAGLAIPVHAAALMLEQYALPENTIRAKLQSIFSTNPETTACTQDKSWVDFGSWHWAIGQLETEDMTKFVVKMAKYRAHSAITTPQYPGIRQIHTPQQNLSRLVRAEQAQHIITEGHLATIKVPACWAYPISGNNQDLCDPRITDQQVVIVEEMIKKKSDDKVWCPLVTDYVQVDVLRLNLNMFDQLVTFAKKGKFLDLNPKNLLVDQQGKLVVIDLEDTIADQREIVKKSLFLVRPFKEFKLRCRQEGAVLHGLGITGVSNTLHPAVKKKGEQLITRSQCTLHIKQNIFEIVALTLLISGALIVMIRRIGSTYTLNNTIKKCRTRIRQLLKAYRVTMYTTPDVYKAIAQQAVKDVAPYENRQELINAFATIAMAQTIKNRHPMVFLGTTYSSFHTAIHESMKIIRAYWKRDQLQITAPKVDVTLHTAPKSVGAVMAW